MKNNLNDVACVVKFVYWATHNLDVQITKFPTVLLFVLNLLFSDFVVQSTMATGVSFIRSVLNTACRSQVNKKMILAPCSQSRLFSTEPPEHHPPSNEPWIPEYIEKFDEPIEDKRNRLMYQSRKRGMLENGLLLGDS